MLYRNIFSTGFLAILLGATLVYAAVTSAEKDEKKTAFKLSPFASLSDQVSLVGRKRAEAECVCEGKEKAFLGLYVYDQHGNCVAWNDLAAARANEADEGAPGSVKVEWYPPETGMHTVTVVNFAGSATDKCTLTVK